MLYMYRYVLIVLPLLFLYSCEISHEEINDYIGYYDKEMTKKKVEGRLYNREESGEWIFYTEDGVISQQGNYSLGLLDGVWNYKLPHIDSAIVWEIIEMDSMKFSLPSTFKFYSKMSDASNTAYQDTTNQSLFGITVINQCDKKCVNDFYNNNLDGFKKNGTEVLFSQSQLIESKSGQYYVDEFNFRPANYHGELKQYMVYKRIDDKLLVLTMTNKIEYEQELKFLIGEVFYHFKYNYKRIAFPYEEIIHLSNVNK